MKENDLASMLRQMIAIRGLEEQAMELGRTDPPAVLGSIHLCAGQEAIPVGAVTALRGSDQIIATYRGHGWALASGLSPLEVLGEICHRTVGINGGRGGSAYMMAPWRRFIGENSIVGAGVPIACGVALANKVLRTGAVVVVSVGDGAFNQGATHEGLAFAAAKQLPVVIICENNGWSEMTPTSEMFKADRIADRAAGYGIAGVTIDGTDPRLVRDTVAIAAERARTGGGPSLIECQVPRLWGHYNRDIQHYRSVRDQQAAAARDPIASLSRQLLHAGVLTESALREIKDEVNDELQGVVRTVLDAPIASAVSARDHVYGPIASADSPSAAGTEGDERTLTYIQAINAALRAELETRAAVVVYGEDVGKAGGIFGASRDLQKWFGADRVFDTPIAENAILGSAVGAALAGIKPVVEIMWADFLLVALDQLVNQAANIRYITGGRSSAPLVVRTQQGVTPGSCAQHSQSLEAVLAHIPGLRIAMPATPQDAYDILRAAVAGSDPCVIIEARALYQSSGRVQQGRLADAIGRARLYGDGTDALIVSWGSMVHTAFEAADRLREEGTDVRVLDLRWLSPLDETALLEAAKAVAGRVVVAHEANITAGFGAEILARLHERLGRKLSLRVIRVGAPDVRMPASPALQQALVPNAMALIAAVRSVISDPQSMSKEALSIAWKAAR